MSALLLNSVLSKIHARIFVPTPLLVLHTPSLQASESKFVALSLTRLQISKMLIRPITFTHQADHVTINRFFISSTDDNLGNILAA